MQVVRECLGPGPPLDDPPGDVDAVTRMLTAQAAKLREANRKLEAQHAATRPLADSPRLLDAAPAVLRAISSTLNWDFRALWILAEPARWLRILCPGYC